MGMQRGRLVLISSVIALAALVLSVGCGRHPPENPTPQTTKWEEKQLTDLSHDELEATLNLANQVLKKILGDQMRNSGTMETDTVPKKSGYVLDLGDSSLRRPLGKKVEGFSTEWRSSEINEKVVARIQTEIERQGIIWNGIMLNVLECVVEVLPQGGDPGFDRVNIYPLKVRVKPYAGDTK